MKRAAIVLALSAMLAFAAAGTAGGNDSAIGGVGGAIHPVAVSDIRMESEAVQLVAYSTYAAVRVDFKFVNSGPERSVELGFPFEVPFEKQDLNDLPPAAGFRAWQDGRPLAVTWAPPVRSDEEPEGGYIGYFTHTATFKPGVTMIRVEYLAQPNSQVPTPDIPAPPAKYAGMLSSNASYEYWVHTGAGWGGTIGKSVIRFSLTPEFQGWGVEEAQRAWAALPDLPAGLPDTALAYEKPAPDTYQWTFTDYEPTVSKGQIISKYDVSLHYFQPAWVDAEYNDAQKPGWPVDRVVAAEASSHLKLGDFEYVPEAAFSGVAWAWAEGVDGSGSGEWVKATFAGERPVTEVRVLPGYAKSPALFAKYNRPKTLTVEFSDGTKKTLSLADEPALQVFPVKASAKWAKVTIGEVYRGTTRDETYISLVDFGSSPSPEFEPFASMLGENPAGGASAGGGSSTAEKPHDGAGGTRAFPVWAVVAIAAAAVFVGLGLVGVLAWLIVRARKH